MPFVSAGAWLLAARLLGATLPGAPGPMTPPVDAGPTLPHGLRGAVEIPDPWGGWRQAALGVFLLAICGLGAWLWWRRRGPGAGAAGVPPADLARQRLQRSLELLDRPQPFVAEVSAAVRTYLEDRFGWRAPDRTTEEFVGELQRNGELAAADRDALSQFLGACDLVKFAGVRPGRVELEELHTAALRLVNELAPAATPVPPALTGVPAVVTGPTSPMESGGRR